MHPTDERPHPRTGRLHLDQTIHVVVSATEALPVTVRFTYDAADPLAVRMDFTGCADVLAPWVFSRDLLFAGLRGSSGVGHVRVWPDRRRHGAGSVRILLSDTEGTAMLRVAGRPVRGVADEDLLGRTHAARRITCTGTTSCGSCCGMTERPPCAVAGPWAVRTQGVRGSPAARQPRRRGLRRGAGRRRRGR